MTPPLPDIYRYIVKALAPTAHKPNETPLTIVCEPLTVLGYLSISSTITMHLKTGTNRAEAQAMNSKMQTKVKALCHVQAAADGEA
jgi:hypothetical protein